jgi:hypothetical protein
VIPGTDTICGVDRGLVERFLALIRDRFPVVDQSTFFLETREGVSNVAALANVRDLVSHLATLLSASTPPDKREAQLANAEEHLRRAATEAYEIALGRAFERFQSVHERYQRKGIGRKGGHLNLPDPVSVNSRLTEIRELASAGRNAKTRNLWDPAWEEGVAQMVLAYDKLAHLSSDMEESIRSLELLKAHDQRRWRAWISLAGVVGTVLFGMLVILFITKPAAVDILRRALGLGR